jgi:hypothetical protein
MSETPMSPERLAEIRAELMVEFAAWLVKKAREYRSTGRRQHVVQADAIATLASKVARGAVRPDNLRTLPAQGGPEDETAGLLAEVERLRAELAARPSRAEVLRGVAAEWAAHCPEHAVADATWMECPCTWVADLRRRADAVEGGGSR